ncbi:hypothetical protein [Nitrospirillum sp. BR 11828]|uniref:hypothetical protein n=1 Tax=Nitrospirillum sp. BR 11828 TaxID=3104325 RepID=UPI002ACA1D7A|nr:hypothetical protein [Nitrospirillum sp. BR 11828]MDZ5648303.1 hypothetical protein [Nitrospirillum sp. BR 11828]
MDPIYDKIDFKKITKITPDLGERGVKGGFSLFLDEATKYLCSHAWVSRIEESYVGIFVDGIVGVFLFLINPSRSNVDNWVWVIVGDLPPAYITCEDCPNPAAALDGYIGAMEEWVKAAENNDPVSEIIPVNLPASPENAERLRGRLKFLGEKILSEYQDDLRAF